MASGGNVDLVLAVSILSSSLVTLSLGAATVREALAVLSDRLRASPVADRLCRTSCRGVAVLYVMLLTLRCSCLPADSPS